MAKHQHLEDMPALVRAFIRRAEAAGIEVRQGERTDDHGRPRLLLHGPVELFKALPEMTTHRIPVRKGHWWLKLGIVGTLYREGNQVAAVVDWTRSPRARGDAYADQLRNARGDVDFARFMSTLMNESGHGI